MAEMEEISKPKLASMSYHFIESGSRGNIQHAADCGDGCEEIDIVYLWHMHFGGHSEKYGNRQKRANSTRRTRYRRLRRGKEKVGREEEEKKRWGLANIYPSWSVPHGICRCDAGAPCSGLILRHKQR